MSYAQDKLYLALHALVGALPIRERLVSAAQAMLMLEPKDFSKADEAQTFVTPAPAPLPGGGTIEVTVEIDY
jgi:hypothetical protein